MVIIIPCLSKGFFLYCKNSENGVFYLFCVFLNSLIAPSLICKTYLILSVCIPILMASVNNSF